MNLEEQYKIIEFSDLGDERGNLVVIEGDGADIPFDIKRVFYIYGSDPGWCGDSTPTGRQSFCW